MLKFCFSFFAFIVCATFFGQSESTKELNVELYFSNQASTAYDIAPDGRNIAFLGDVNGYMNLFIQPLPKSKPEQVTRYSDRSISKFIWSGSKSIGFELMSADQKSSSVHILDLENFQVYDLSKDGENAKIENPSWLKASLIYSVDVKDANRRNVFSYDHTERENSLIREGEQGEYDWCFDVSGNILASLRAESGQIKVISTSSLKTKVALFEMNETVVPVCPDPNNKESYIFLTDRDFDRIGLTSFSLLNAAPGVEYFHKDDMDIVDVNYSPSAKSILAVHLANGVNREIECLESNYCELQAEIQSKYFSGAKFEILNWDDAGNYFLIRQSSTSQNELYFLYSRKDKRLITLSNVSLDINASQYFSATHQFVYPGENGEVMTGLLTLPLGSKLNVPLLVLVRDWPWIYPSADFDREVQYFARLGYAVFQPTYHGSAGRGRKFAMDACHCANQIQDDIANAVHALQIAGTANPDNVVIMGKGMGAYVAMQALTMHPDLYSGGIIVNGLADPMRLIDSQLDLLDEGNEKVAVWLGNPRLNGDVFQKYSPLEQAANISDPLLIVSSASDEFFSAESEQIHSRLEFLGVAHENLILQGEVYDIVNPSNRITFAKTVGDFLMRIKNPLDNPRRK